MRGLVCLACLVVAMPAAASENVRFYATVDRDRVELGQALTLTVTISVDQSELMRNLVLPQPKGFDRISTAQGVQTSFTFGAGGQRAERVTTHTVVLRATTSGAQTIPPAVMEYKGVPHRTDPITVAVLPVGDLQRRGQAGRGGQQRGRAPSVFDDDFDPMDIFDQLQRQLGGDIFGQGHSPSPVPPPQVADGDVFVRVGVDKKEAWLGEQVTADIVIYSRHDISGFPSPPSMPQMDGFWQEDIERPRQIRPEMRTLKGVPYRAYLLRRLALFPTRAGELVIDPIEVEVETGLGLFRGGRSVKRRSHPVTINVRPLPVEGQPTGFSSTNVGDWRMALSLDRPATTTGEPVTLTVSISGNGNVHAVQPPELGEIDGVRIYEPTRTQDPNIRGGRFGGTKKVSWVLVPSRTGSFTIPRMDLHYFDPTIGSYRKSSAGPLSLVVTAGGAASFAGGGHAARGAGRNLLEADGLRTIRYGISPALVGPPPFKSPWFIGGIIASAVLLLSFSAFDGVRRNLASAAEAGRGKRAPAVAKTRLKAAQRLLQRGETSAAVTEALGAVRGYVEAVTDLSTRGLPREAVRQALIGRGVPSALVESVCRVMDRCESIVYSPFEPDTAEVSAAVEQVSGALSELFALQLDLGCGR